MDLTQDQLQTLGKIVADELAEKKRAQWLDPDSHHEQHLWIKDKMRREKEWQDLRKKILVSSVSWALPILIGGSAAIFWREFVRFITKTQGGE